MSSVFQSKKYGALKNIQNLKSSTKKAIRMRDTPVISGNVPHSLTWSDMLRPRPHMVRAWGLEPQRRKAREPKSRMSANFIMPA